MSCEALLWMWAGTQVHSTTFISDVNIGNDLTDEQKAAFSHCALCCDEARPSLAKLTAEHLTYGGAEVIGNMTFMNGTTVRLAAIQMERTHDMHAHVKEYIRIAAKHGLCINKCVVRADHLPTASQNSNTMHPSRP